MAMKAASAKGGENGVIKCRRRNGGNDRRQHRKRGVPNENGLAISAINIAGEMASAWQ
jgi:hypothetical protein